MKGVARQFYFDNLQSKFLNPDEFAQAVLKRFETPEITRALLGEWNGLKFNKVVSMNVEKAGSEFLEVFITRLADIQSSLPVEYPNDIIFRNKLFNAVQNVDAFRLAYHKPAETVQGLIPDLYASLAVTFRVNVPGPVFHTEIAIHYADRRYMCPASSKFQGNSKKHRK